MLLLLLMMCARPMCPEIDRSPRKSERECAKTNQPTHQGVVVVAATPDHISLIGQAGSGFNTVQLRSYSLIAIAAVQEDHYCAYY